MQAKNRKPCQLPTTTLKKKCKEKKISCAYKSKYQMISALQRKGVNLSNLPEKSYKKKSHCKKNAKPEAVRREKARKAAKKYRAGLALLKKRRKKGSKLWRKAHSKKKKKKK